MMAAIRYYERVRGKVELKGDEVKVELGDAPVSLFDFRKWKEPPHLALANLTSDARALYRFARHYGVLVARLSAGWMHLSVHDAEPFREHLRKAWEGETEVLNQMSAGRQARLQVLPSGVEIIVEDLWTLIRLMFLHDWALGRAKKCGNSACQTPYFLAVRKGQKFCSQRCAVLINVRRFRERQAREQARKKNQSRRRGKHAKAKKA